MGYYPDEFFYLPERPVIAGNLYRYNFPRRLMYLNLGQTMSGKKAVDKVSKGLTSLIDEFSSAVKEMVNAGEETVVHLAVGSSRVIKAAVDATGEVTKITVETASNVVSSVTGGVAKAVSSKARQQNQEEE